MKLKELHPNIKLRLVVQFFVTLSSMSVLPYLPIYFASRLGETITGFMLIILIIPAIAGGFIGGHFSDKLGRKKMMVIAESLITTSFLFIALVNSPFLDLPYVTFALFTFNLFGQGLFLPSVQAMIIDASHPENRKFIFGFNYWSNNLGTAVGGILGAFFFKSYRFELFLAIFLISFLSFMTTFFFIKETSKDTDLNIVRPQTDPPPRSSIKNSLFLSYIPVFKDKLFLHFFIASVLITSLELELTNYIGVRLSRQVTNRIMFPNTPFHFQLDGIKILGLLRSENTILVVTLAVLTGWFVKRFSDSKLLYFGLFSYTIGYTILGFSNTPSVLFLFMLILTMGEIIYVPIKQGFLSDIPPQNKRSTYMAVIGLAEQISMIIGSISIILGAFLSRWEMSALFFIMGISAIVLLRNIMPQLLLKREKQISSLSDHHVSS